jgi:hypothetical protein
VSQYIETIRPKVEDAAWRRVFAEVQRIVKAAEPDTPYSARELLGPLAKLAVFADGRGMPGSADVWLDREVIELFISLGCPDVSEATRANYRSRLVRLREALFGPDLPGGPPARLSGSTASRPYTGSELSGLWSSAAGQPTGQLRDGLKTLLALGMGCGLDSPEVIPLRVHDVRRTGPSGPVVVAVRGRRARLVVCRAAWENVLADVVERATAGSWLFRPDATARSTNTVTNFLDRTRPSTEALRLVMGRARATWIVELINAQVPLPVLVAAAGVDSLHALSRLMPHVAVVGADEAARFLRGEP